MKTRHFAALLALAPALLCAQPPAPDPTTGVQGMDTVFLNNLTAAQNDFTAQQGVLKSVIGGGYTSPAGIAARVAIQNDAQNYQDNMNGLLDANSMAHAPGVEYKQLVAYGEVAARTKDAAERKHLLGNFLFNSRGYLQSYPNSPRLWAMRGAAALQLNKQATGTEAAKFLLAMPDDQRADPHIQKLIEIMGKKGWLPPEATGAAPAPTAQPASVQVQK